MSSRAVVAAEAATAAAIHPLQTEKIKCNLRNAYLHIVSTLCTVQIFIYGWYGTVCVSNAIAKGTACRKRTRWCVQCAHRAHVYPKFNPLSSLPSSCVRHNFSLLFFFVCVILISILSAQIKCEYVNTLLNGWALYTLSVCDVTARHASIVRN